MKKLFISFLSIFILITNLNSQSFKGKLNYSFVGPTQLDMKIDLMQDHKVKLINTSNQKISNLKLQFDALNSDGSVATPANGFAWFPQGRVNLEPGDSVIVQAWSHGWRDCNNCNLINGENNKKIRFIFYQDPSISTDRDTVIYDIKLINNDTSKVNSITYVNNVGDYIISGSFKLPAYVKDSVLSTIFFLQNPGITQGYQGTNTNGWQITPNTITSNTSGDQFYNFNFKVNSRSDWRIQARVTMKNGVNWMIPYSNAFIKGSGNNFYNVLQPFGTANFSVDSVKMYKTQTGFWRGVFVPGDSTLICFPGQENWLSGNTYKVNSRIYKIKLDTKNFGDTTWSYLIGDETWGGAASKNGKYVTYLLNQGGMDQSNPDKDWLVILDGLTGKKIWGSGGNLGTTNYQGLEVGMNFDGKYFAVGATEWGTITLFQNNHAINGQPTVTKLWDYNCNGQVRKIVFTDDGKYVYAGSGDMFLRKFNVSDGTLLWKEYIGGWPFVNGFQFSTDSNYIYTGAKSFDLTRIDANTGQVLWKDFIDGLDAHVSSDDKYSMDMGGQMVDNSTGNIIGKTGNPGQRSFAYLNDFVISADTRIEIFNPTGNSFFTRSTYMGLNPGEYSQFSWNDTLGTKLVLIARDFNSPPPNNGIGTWKITPTINRYPTLDSIPNISVSTGDSTFTILHYNDRDGNPLSVSATSYLGNITARLGNKDTLWIKAAKGYIGSDTIKVIVKESNTIQKFSVYNIFIANSSCPSNSNFLIKSLNATTICSGQSDTLTSNLSSSNQWYLNGTVINGANGVNLVATSPGFYTDTAINEAGCKVGSQKIQIIVNPIPQAPLLSRDTSNYLFSNISTGNFWYKDGTALTDTTQKIKPTTPGSYTAKTIQNGCLSASSAPYYFIVTDIINLSADEFIKLSPNPFTNQLNFDFFIKGYQRLNMELFNIATGTKVSSKLNLTPGMPIYLGHLSSGTYVIRVTSNDLKISYQFKMVKL
jgi:PQQ-like domain